jgi:CubicO group peptidase (beta-lactamase class C family)
VKQSQQIARAVLAEQNLPGLSVAVGVHGDMVWAEGFGWADIEKQVPVAPHTRFRIGHASKALTSAAVGLLLEKRRLRLDDEIQTYVPEFPRKQWPVTLRQLMGHASGIRHYNSEADYMPSAHCERASEGLQSFADDPLLFEPETAQVFDVRMDPRGAAVEAAADEPFFTFMRTQIFEPLGMAGTTVDSASEPIADRATFYEEKFELVRDRRPARTVDYSCFAGAGAFLSTPSDLVRFGLAISSGKLLEPTTVSMLQTPQQLVSGADRIRPRWMPIPCRRANGPAGEPQPNVGMAPYRSDLPTAGRRCPATNISFANTRSMALKIAEAFAEHAKRPAGK